MREAVRLIMMGNRLTSKTGGDPIREPARITCRSAFASAVVWLADPTKRCVAAWQSPLRCSDAAAPCLDKSEGKRPFDRVLRLNSDASIPAECGSAVRAAPGTQNSNATPTAGSSAGISRGKELYRGALPQNRAIRPISNRCVGAAG